MPISRQPERIAFQQLMFDQLFTWPTDQPRHATSTYGNPVESNRPRFFRSDRTLSMISVCEGESIALDRDKETRRQGDKETRRQGDGETGRRGDGETGR